jgi:putative transposase
MAQHLEKLGIKFSMDSKGSASDNARIERFWKSIKHDHTYLNPCDDGFELFEGVQNHIEYYNQKVHHATKQKHDYRYQESLNQIAA